MNYEYAHDLNYYYSPGAGNPIAAATGFPWVKAVADLFEVGPKSTTSNGTFTPGPLLMGFTVRFLWVTSIIRAIDSVIARQQFAPCPGGTWYLE